jgi:hypothetical protein
MTVAIAFVGIALALPANVARAGVKGLMGVAELMLTGQLRNRKKQG